MNNQNPFALLNGRIILPDHVVEGKAVVVEDGMIAGIADVGELGNEMERVDVAGRIITPGLIDIHTHGALGHTFNEPTAEAFGVITTENARRGVTSLLATTATAPIPDLVSSLVDFADFRLKIVFINRFLNLDGRAVRFPGGLRLCHHRPAERKGNDHHQHNNS